MLYQDTSIDSIQISRIADKILDECDNKHRGSIDFEDFQIAMYLSDLEKNCTIYF